MGARDHPANDHEGSTMAPLSIQFDRARRTSLAGQIYSAIRESIENGQLASGARLPSWRDLAAQLGVSRGTVRVAYERLIAEHFAKRGHGRVFYSAANEKGDLGTGIFHPGADVAIPRRAIEVTPRKQTELRCWWVGGLLNEGLPRIARTMNDRAIAGQLKAHR
jgi:DNA-binding transcriptional MocR family regulator